MKKFKIMSVFGTRPEAIKMAPLVKALAVRDCFESICCLTGQHRQMLDSVMEIFHLRSDYDLDIMEKSQTLSTITTKTLLGMDHVIDEAQPDMILVQRKGGIELHALQIELAADALIKQVLGVVLVQKLTVDAAVERMPADAAELLSLLRGLVDALIAHLNELIQVGGDDGEKLGALQKRVVGIVRLLLYSPVKRKPTQFAVLDGVPLCFAFVRRTHISPSFHAPCKSVIYHYSTSKKRLSTLDAHRTAFSSFHPPPERHACLRQARTGRGARLAAAAAACAPG